jgi:hypothetical protein
VLRLQESFAIVLTSDSAFASQFDVFFTIDSFYIVWQVKSIQDEPEVSSLNQEPESAIIRIKAVTFRSGVRQYEFYLAERRLEDCASMSLGSFALSISTVGK